VGEVIKFPVSAGENETEEVQLDMAKVVDLLETLISLLKTQPTIRNNISSRTEYLSGAESKDLIRIVNQSGKNDWLQRPAYFAAVINKLRAIGKL